MSVHLSMWSTMWSIKKRRWHSLIVAIGALVFVSATASAQTVLVANDPTTVTITADAPAILQFEAQAGDVVSLNTQALPDATDDENTLDTTIALIAPDDTQLAYNDDTHLADATGTMAIERNAQLQAVVLPQDGQYRVRVDSFNGVSEGDVDVTLTFDDPFAAQIIEETDDTVIITLMLPASAIYSYPIALEAQTRMTITARDTSGTLDPIIQVRDSAGNIVVQNDDHTTPLVSLNVLDAQVTNWPVPEADEYIIEVVDFAGQAGTLQLTIEMTDMP